MASFYSNETVSVQHIAAPIKKAPTADLVVRSKELAATGVPAFFANWRAIRDTYRAA